MDGRAIPVLCAQVEPRNIAYTMTLADDSAHAKISSACANAATPCATSMVANTTHHLPPTTQKPKPKNEPIANLLRKKALIYFPRFMKTNYLSITRTDHFTTETSTLEANRCRFQMDARLKYTGDNPMTHPCCSRS
jgi:hypothetical protein